MSDARESDHRPYERQIQTPSGPVGYLDSGGDLPVALFVHGAATSSTLWRNALPLLADQRRCIAVDLPLHGRTPAAPEQQFSLTALADFLTCFCESLGLTELDLLAHDTGGAIAQVFAVREAHRLRTLTLTNCDTQGNLPPKAFMPTVWLARAGLLARVGRGLLDNIPRARRRLFASTYQNVESVPEDVVRGWLQPIFGTKTSAGRFQRWIATMNDRELVAIEPELRRLQVPTMLIWGTGDPFFKLRWAQWLRETVPGAGEVVEVPDGKLFFPDERADEFAVAVRRHWLAHDGLRSSATDSASRLGDQVRPG